ncbi:hypothetical protein F4778DRAFT_797981 [Xylariomycetidae sp. FL2044]|nr:hypothetical protein F4778DRAFT_797981 [Xylariomycetidae sp. FL2044]
MNPNSDMAGSTSTPSAPMIPETAPKPSSSQAASEKEPSPPQPQNNNSNNQDCVEHQQQCPFQDRPKLRWACLIGLVVLVFGVLIVGIVLAVLYNSIWYRAGKLLLDHVGDRHSDDDDDGKAAVAAVGWPATGSSDDGSLGVVGGGGGDDVLGDEESEGGRIESREMIPPWKNCGDQQNGCDKFDLPNICCPVGLACQATHFSPSGVFCCPDGSSSTGCRATRDTPPRCPDLTRPCGRELGGGCCAAGTKCAEEGCIAVYRADTDSNNNSEPGPGPGPGPFTPTPTTTTTTTTTGGGQRTRTQDVFTRTTTKIGETAQSRGVRLSMMMMTTTTTTTRGPGFTSWPALEALVLVGAVVGAWIMVLRTG